MAIGTHDGYQGPFDYEARAPTDIVFKQLFETTERDAKEYMDYIGPPGKENNLGFTDIATFSSLLVVMTPTGSCFPCRQSLMGSTARCLSTQRTSSLSALLQTTRGNRTLNTMICFRSTTRTSQWARRSSTGMIRWHSRAEDIDF